MKVQPMEMTLAVEVGHKGHFCLDSLFKDRGIMVAELLTCRVNAEEIDEMNWRNFKVEVTDNVIHYERVKPVKRGEEDMTIKVYFDIAVNWPAHL